MFLQSVQNLILVKQKNVHSSEQQQVLYQSNLVILSRDKLQSDLWFALSDKMGRKNKFTEDDNSLVN
jgi:hypothetical protein